MGGAGRVRPLAVRGRLGLDADAVLGDDALITATRKLNEALAELSRAIGDEGKMTIPDSDRQNLAKFLTISRARLDNLVARLKSGRA